jgi:hypothetical protein
MLFADATRGGKDPIEIDPAERSGRFRTVVIW